MARKGHEGYADSITVGTLTIDDNGVNDVAVMDTDSSECMICRKPTDHRSGVCDGCNESEGPTLELDDIAA
jgi:hypothetical protein|tara:strand:- start:1778 stop:1990 length:213 start_codon:yes stop_codon:yes gene_type:complete